MSAINHTTWRQTPHVIDGYLRILKPSTVFSCNVNQSSFVYPIAQITYDGGSGDYADIVVGQTIRVTSSAGVHKGFLRVRAAATASVIYFGHVSQGEIYFENNDIFTVLNDFRLWSRLPYYLDDGTLYKDWNLAYANQKLPPVCVAGPDRAKFVSGGVASFDFDLTDSYVTDSGASSISTYSADLPTGVSVSSGSIASGEFTLECDPGEYYVHFTVEDDLGTTHTRHVYILAAEKTGANAPLRCAVESLNSSVEQGTEGKFALLEDTLDTTAFHDGAHVIVFVDEDYGATSGSINGYADAENVAFVGWLRNIEVTQEPGLSDIVIDCAGAFGIAELHRAFPLSVQRMTSPSDWDQLTGLDIWKNVVYLLHWQSTLLNVADLVEPAWVGTYPIADRLESQYGSIIDQMQFLANAVGGKFTCDLQGRCYVKKFPPLMTTTERAGLVTIVQLEAQDWTGKMDIRKRNYDGASWIRGAAVLASASDITALASIAPGTSPAQGIIEEQTNHHIVASQSELNTRTGHKFALENMKYEPFDIEVFRAGRPIDPAWQEVITFDNPAALNRRGMEFTTNDLFIVNELDIEFDHETGTTSEKWNVQLVTSGIPGTTVPVVEDVLDDFSYVPFLPWTPFDFYIPEPITELPGLPNLVFTDTPAMYAATPSGAYRSRDTSLPSWSSVFDTATVVGASYALCRFKLDPWNPKNGAWIVVCDYTAGIIKIYSTTSLDSAVPSWTLEHTITPASGTIALGIDMQLSINIEGYVAVAYNLVNAPSDDPYKISYRLSPTSSWVDDTAYNSTFSAGVMATLGMGSHQVWPNGDVYIRGGIGSGGNRIFIYKSTDLGQNWSEDEVISYGNYGQPMCIAVPYLNNPNDEIVWFFLQADDADLAVFRRNADGSYTYTLAPAAASGYFYIADSDIGGQNAADIWTGDEDEIRYVSANQDGGSYRQLVYSEDGGSSWTNKDLPSDLFYAIGGWPSDVNVIFIYGAAVLYWTDDKGDTWYDLRGDGVSADDLFVLADDDNVVDFVAVWVP